MLKLKVLNNEGKESSTINLPKEIFGGRVNAALLHQAVVMYQASQRQGTAKAKGRKEVSGGGKKPFKQKGTGRARQGSSRSPLMKGGGVTFGPQPRDYSYSISKQMKRAALRESLNAKYMDENLVCIEDIKDVFDKTKNFAAVLQNLKIRGKVLAVLDGSDESLSRVSRNIPRVSLLRLQDINAYDVMKNKNFLVSKTALNGLIDRVRKDDTGSQDEGNES